MEIYFEKKKSEKFTKLSIIKNNLSIINHIDKIKKKYDFILVSVISPLKKTREFAHKKFNKHYYEVIQNVI